jgi:uncharacterized membrane protein YphA (DoxX/SURF4 family)
MALTRRLARPLLASIFVVGGFDALRNPAGKAQKARAVTEPLHDNVPATAGLDTEALVRINGGVQVVAGVLLATGRFRRVASLVLIGSLVPTTYAGHRFWEETDEAARAQQKMHFVKNLGLLGGLILAAFDTEGEPSLGWRTKRRVRAFDLRRGRNHREPGSIDMTPLAKEVIASVPVVAGAVAQGGTRAAKRAHRAGQRAGRQMKHKGIDMVQKGSDAGDGFGDATAAVAETIRGSGGAAAHALQRTGAALATTARELEPSAEKAVHAGTERIGDALTQTVPAVTRIISEQMR